MKNTNSIKRKFFIYQVFAISFFVLGIIGRIFQNSDYDILLFRKPIIYSLYMICFLLFYITEVLSIVFLFKKTQKKLVLLTYLILIPLLILHFFTWFISSSTTISTKLYKYPEFETAILIENGHDLLGNHSRIFETQNNFVIKKVALVTGVEPPLEDDSSFDVKIYKDKIIYTYDDGFDKQQLALKYNNGHFKEELSE